MTVATLDLIDSLIAYAAVKVQKATAQGAFRDRERMAREERAMVRSISAYFAGLARRLQVGHVEVAKYAATDWDREARLMGEALKAGREAFLGAGMARAGTEVGVNLQGALDLGDYDLSIRDKLAQNVVGINDTTRTRIQQTVTSGVQTGMTNDALNVALRQQIQGWSLSTGRASTIARTESALAYNLGQAQGYRNSGLVDEVRIFDGAGCGWTEHDDGDEANGSIRTLEEAEKYPIAHPNCLRAWAPVIGRAATAEEQRAARQRPDAMSQPGKQTSTEDLYFHDTPDGPRWDPTRRATVHERWYAEVAPADLPVSDAPRVYMTGGGPASGKSAVLEHFPDLKRAAYINADDAKVAIPEMRQGVRLGHQTAANAVHEESSYMSKEVLKRALGRGNDAVYDSVANGTIDSLTGKVVKMRAQGASRVSAEYVYSDIDLALERAYIRGVKTKRFVGDAEVIEKHRAVSQVSRQAMESGLYDDMAFYSTNSGFPPTKVATWTREGGLKVIDRSEWERFVNVDSTYTGRYSADTGIIEGPLRPGASSSAPAADRAAVDAAMRQRAEDLASVGKSGLTRKLGPQAITPYVMGSMTADEARMVVLDVSGGWEPGLRNPYTDAMRAYWLRIEQWYLDNPGYIMDVSDELEVDTEDEIPAA